MVVGWTDPTGSRPHFGALLLGYYTEDGRLLYAGRAGTGFTDSELASFCSPRSGSTPRGAPISHIDDRRGAAGATLLAWCMGVATVLGIIGLVVKFW